MLQKILDRVFDERVARSFAAIFFLSFAYMIIFGKGFEGMESSQAYVFGLATVLSFKKLFPDSNDEQPRRKIPWRRGSS